MRPTASARPGTVPGCRRLPAPRHASAGARCPVAAAEGTTAERPGACLLAAAEGSTAEGRAAAFGVRLAVTGRRAARGRLAAEGRATAKGRRAGIRPVTGVGLAAERRPAAERLRPRASCGSSWALTGRSRRGVRRAVRVLSAGPASSGPRLPVGMAPRAPWADKAAASCSDTTSAAGSSTMAVVPPKPDSRSDTLIPLRTASRLTTNRPSWSLSARSNSTGCASRSLSLSRAAGGMPRPRSSISIT